MPKAIHTLKHACLNMIRRKACIVFVREYDLYSITQWKKRQGWVSHHSKILPYGTLEIESVTVVLVPDSLKRTDCFWSQCSKSNLLNTNACLLQSQMNFSLLSEMAPGEVYYFVLRAPVHSFYHYSSLIFYFPRNGTYVPNSVTTSARRNM